MCISEISSLLYYAYLPTIFLGMFFGVFIYLSDKKATINKILVLISIVFSFYATIDFLSWFPFSMQVYEVLSKLLMFVLILLPLLIHFAYNLIKIETSKVLLFLIWAPFAPIFLINFSKYSYLLFSVNRNGLDCVVNSSILYPYIYFLSAIYFFWFVFILVRHYKNNSTDSVVKSRIRNVIVATCILIGWFVLLIKMQDFLGDNALMLIPFGMLMFIVILSYAIVRYQLFEIKLIAAQVLTYASWALIASQYFFAESTTVYVLVSVTLFISIFFGIFLIRSINKEAERKEELQQMADKLASANDSLRKLDNAKTEFISIASHQLRTPITAIKGFSSLILEGSYGEVSEGVHGALDKIYLSAERLVNLIEDLLNVSRIESGRMSFVFEKASMEKLLKELYDNFVLVAKDKKFYLDLNVPETPLPDVAMDYTKIRELTSNFIDNALKYTEKGGVTIKAELRESGIMVDEKGFVIEGQKSTFGPVVRVTVSDTGIGIPKEEIPYLFKKFSRGKDVSRLHVGGTGLGLYVGKAIAEAHNGQVWIESEGAGMGSRFIIEVPVEHVA